MREFFRTNRTGSVLFAACALVFVVIWLLWTVPLPFIGESPAEIDDVAGAIPLLGDLPTQSVSKLVISGALYVMSVAYALLSLGGSPFRRLLPMFAGLGILTIVAWMMLNFWIVSGFLNSPATLIYGALSIVLLVVWFGGLMRFISNYHDATALFLVRLGLGLSLFITIVQIVALLTPGWRSPTQGIPVLYTMTLNALVGIFLAGVGGNMLWRDRRAQVLAAGSRRR